MNRKRKARPLRLAGARIRSNDHATVLLSARRHAAFQTPLQLRLARRTVRRRLVAGPIRGLAILRASGVLSAQRFCRTRSKSGQRQQGAKHIGSEAQHGHRPPTHRERILNQNPVCGYLYNGFLSTGHGMNRN